MKIIGIGGMNGSGKDTVAKYLSEKFGFLNASATEMFLEELKKRGWPPDRESKRKLSAEWRREFGLGVIVDKGVELYNADPKKYKGLAVGSLRNPGEADRVHELGGIMLWVDAEPSIRYERIQKNLAERKGTHVEENKTFEEFLAEEKAEMKHSGDAATLSMGDVKARADITLDNSANVDSFKKTIEKALAAYL